MKWAIVDLDGTLADCRWREQFAADARRATDPETRARLWRTFHSKCSEDLPIEPVADIVLAWARAGHGVMYLTGRGVEWHHETMAWLRKHTLPAHPAHLLMRGDGDWRGAAEFKRDMYERLLASPIWRRGGHEIVFVLEDVDKLVAMWRELGLLCLQVKT